jgi:methylenetetrahydrofolate reductase (NADPH)
VTYGRAARRAEKTIEIVTRIKRDHGLEAMRISPASAIPATRSPSSSTVSPTPGSRTCSPCAATRRGDATFVRPDNGFGYASELAAFIAGGGYPFCLAGAGYPEGHPECSALEDDVGTCAPRWTPASR